MPSANSAEDAALWDMVARQCGYKNRAEMDNDPLRAIEAAIKKRIDDELTNRGEESHVIYSCYKYSDDEEKKCLGHHDLDAVALEGGPYEVFRGGDDYYSINSGNGKSYTSKVTYTNPTYLQLVLECNKGIEATGDFQHVFFGERKHDRARNGLVVTERVNM